MSIIKIESMLFLTVSFFLLLSLAGCGYQFSSSPYQLRLSGDSLSISIPVAENHSRFGHLGPELTRAVIARLSGVPGLTIQTTSAESSLKMTIVSVGVGSGSWDVVGTSSGETPEASASRTAGVMVEVVFIRPGLDGGPARSSRRTFGSSRTYMVSQNQGQLEMQEAEALSWIIEDLSQKIAMLMFNEF